MRSICFYFQVHQPNRLRTYRFFDIGEKHDYYDNYTNRLIMRRVADKSYLPMNALLLDLIKEHGSAFKVSFSISGIAIEQMKQYAPDALESFKKLAKTGNVEFLTETYAHSLASLKSRKEFEKQVKMHSELIEETFGVKPTTFRNTELIYSDEIGTMVYDMGYELMLTEGAKHVLGWRSPNFMYANAINPKLKLLLKNFQLSDDIAFRFSEQGWSEWPLTTKKFVNWLNKIDPNDEVINLFMDYETFGEHQWEDTGIFEFMKELPSRVFKESDYTFNTPSELAKKLQPKGVINVPYPISWADEERDLTAWLGNDFQDEAFEKLYALENKVAGCDDQEIQYDWLNLQTSDHFYYMCTKWFSDGEVHKYFNPYGSPYEAFINYMNVLSDFTMRVDQYIEENNVDLESIKEKSTELLEEAQKNVKKIIKKTEKKVRKLTNKSKDLKFEDIKDLSNSAVKKLLKEVDLNDLAIALKDAGEEVTEKVIPNLGKRAQKSLEEIQKELGKIKKSEINKVRKDVEKKLKDLFGKK
jgi:alpha-amylase